MDLKTFGRLKVKSVPGVEEVFTPPVAFLLEKVFDQFNPEVVRLREKRAAMWGEIHSAVEKKGIAAISEAIRRLLSDAIRKFTPPQTWKVDIPESMRRPGVHICNGVWIDNMALNAVNPMPPIPEFALKLPEVSRWKNALTKPARAVGYLDCDEDAGGNHIESTVRAAINRKKIAERLMTVQKDERTVGIADETEHGPLPVRWHRERGMILDEPELWFDGKPVPASILGIVLMLYHAGRVEAARGEPIGIYYPKGEDPEELKMIHDLIDFIKKEVPELKSAKIKVAILVESLPMIFVMREALYALGEYACGLNYARWDLSASILEGTMTDSNAVWPDRYGVTPWNTPFLTDIGHHIVAVTDEHGALAMGGMDVQLVDRRDRAVTEIAIRAIAGAKSNEARVGFPLSWGAHPDLALLIQVIHQAIALDGRAPKRAADYPVRIQVPKGEITVEGGTARDIRTILEYLASPRGWFAGFGAVAIDNQPDNPDPHTPLMDDLATYRMSVAAVAQRLRHEVVGADGIEHNLGMISELFTRERDGAILRWKIRRDAGQISDAEFANLEKNYHLAARIGLQWVEKYADLDFTPLPAFTRQELISRVG